MIRLHRALPLVIACALALPGCAWLFPNEARFIGVADAPKAAGANVPGVAYGGMLYAAGFTPRDPATGAVVEGGITAQTNRVLDNLEAALKGAGCTFKDVVEVNVFLSDFSDTTRMNEALAARFGGNKPARVSRPLVRFPEPVLLEADFVARMPR